MTPSKYQQDIYSTVLTTNKNIAVSATAGSGKTTTIVEAAKLIPYGKRALFVAFNRDIVKVLRERLPEGIECSTIHSMGCRAIYNYYEGGNNSVDDKKQINIISPLCEKEGRTPKEKWSLTYRVDKIMNLVRATMTEQTRDGINDMCEKYAIDNSDEETAIAIKALRELDKYNNDPDRRSICINFMDMIALPALNKYIRVNQYDYVFIDEAQDCSKLDQLLLNRFVKPITGRKIIVGDPNQSIYGFRGADPKSFQSFVNQPNTIVLPLSISYRCAKAIVREAKTIYPEIEEYEQNQEGIVREGKIEEIQEGDFVLCRNVRPLVEIFFDLIEAGKKAYIRGKDIEKGLLGLLSKIDSSAECQAVTENLNKMLEESKNSLTEKGIKNPSLHPKFIIIEEKIQILKSLFRKFVYVYQVEHWIETVFDDENREGVMMSTIHKSKGLENDRVFVIEKYEGKKLIPSRYAVTPDQLTQERNLLFVAYTRAKKELVKISM